RAVAADASVLPLGQRVAIEGLGQYVVEDRFAWDANMKRLDVWVPTCSEAIQGGVEYRGVELLRPWNIQGKDK
ncbi:MAG: 3D domain-containing protein, partial [Chloroflexi bacterium]|nr:3D domain-containing protein [Chloroflexota bacterium]